MGGELQNISSKYRTNRLFKSRRFRTRNLLRSFRFINGFSTSACAIYLYGTNRRYRHSMPTTSGLAWDYILKFIIIGDASVGKSSILVRFTEDKFLVDSDTTIGIEFGSHIVTLESGERLKLQKLGLLLSKRFFAYQDDQTYFQRVQLWHSLPPDFVHHRASLASARKYRAPSRHTPKDILQLLCNKNE